ncbi:MAG TPA: hypothetical protein VF614_10445, partial [Chthoniobacteraceae bacterium]
MNSSIFSSLEPLEQRIAPAGLVTATFADGLLTINGTDGADHNVEIVKTGLNKFRVDGIGTDVGAAGETSKSFKGVLKTIDINGGIGADTFTLTNLSALKNLSFNGDAGVDSLQTSNLKSKAGGKVEIALGSESGSINFGGDKTALRGTLDLDLGGGGTATFASAITKVAGNVLITGGAASDSILITGAETLLKQKLTFTAGDGSDSFNASGTSLTVQGEVSFDGGSGTDEFLFNAKRNIFGKATAPAPVDLSLGIGTGTINFGGDSTQIIGNLSIDLGSSGGAARLNSAATTISDAVVVEGGAGNNVLEFNGRASLASSLSYIGGAGDNTLLATGALFSVKGATSMEGGVGAAILSVNVDRVALAG